MANDQSSGAETTDSDETAHLRSAIEHGQGIEMDRLTRAINLLGGAIQGYYLPEFGQLFANDLAAMLCFTRAYRNLRGSTTLLMAGYYTEIPALLRSAFESASAGRLLAKEPDRAEVWLKKGTVFYEKDVRAWLRETNRASDADLAQFVQGYRAQNDRTHPTARSVILLLRLDDGRASLRVMTEFRQDAFESLMLEITATALFCCFALRNAAVDERAIPAEWRKALYELAQELSPAELPHLRRDWEAETEAFKVFRERVRKAEELQEHLKEAPTSWDNVKPQ